MFKATIDNDCVVPTCGAMELMGKVSQEATVPGFEKWIKCIRKPQRHVVV